jgi:hypothetical protein
MSERGPTAAGAQASLTPDGGCGELLCGCQRALMPLDHPIWMMRA